jgi:hypothetical protein
VVITCVSKPKSQIFLGISQPQLKKIFFFCVNKSALDRLWLQGTFKSQGQGRQRVNWVSGQRHTPAALPPGKSRYPLYSRLGGPQGRSGRVRKIPPPPGFDSRTVQPVASRYTDWVVPTHNKVYVLDYPCTLFPNITPYIREYTVLCLMSGYASQSAVPKLLPRVPGRWPGDRWMHFCIGLFEVYFFFN